MPTGKVKWFNDQKGYGFIKQADGQEDIFVHQSQIKMEGYRTLFPDQEVEFEIKQDHRGLKAVAVRAVAPPTGKKA